MATIGGKGKQADNNNNDNIPPVCWPPLAPSPCAARHE